MAMDVSSLAVNVKSNGVTTTTKEIQNLTVASEKADVAVGGLGNSVETAASKTNIFSGALKLVGGILSARMLYGAAQEAIAMADAWAMMTARLTVVTGSTQEAVKSQQMLFEMSQKLRVPIEATTQLFTRLVPALKAFGYNAETAGKVTEGVSLALKLSGATGAEVSSVMLQLSQSFAAGRLNGAEFNAVAEGAPLILAALEKQTGKTRGELKKLGSDGKLTTDVLTQAIMKMMPEWEDSFSQLPLTVDAALTQISNAFKKAIGEWNADSGFTATLANGLKFIADNAELLVQIINGTLIGAIVLLTAKIGLSTIATVSDTAMILLRNKALDAEAKIALEAAAAEVIRVKAIQSGAISGVSAADKASQLAAATERLAIAQGNATKASSLFGVSISGSLRYLTAFINPVTLGVAALAAFAVGLYLARDETVSFGDTTATVGEWVAGVWETLKDVIGEFWGWLNSKAESILNAVGMDFNGFADLAMKALRAIWAVASPVIDGMIKAFLYLGDVVVEIFTFVGKFIGNTLSAIYTESKQIFSSIGKVFTSLLSGDIKGAFVAIGEGFSGMVDNTVNFFSTIASDSKGVVSALVGSGSLLTAYSDIGNRIEQNTRLVNSASEYEKQRAQQQDYYAQQDIENTNRKGAVDEKAAKEAARRAAKAQREREKIEAANAAFEKRESEALTKAIEQRNEIIRKYQEEVTEIQHKIDALALEEAGIKQTAAMEQARTVEIQKQNLESLKKLQILEQEKENQLYIKMIEDLGNKASLKAINEEIQKLQRKQDVREEEINGLAALIAKQQEYTVALAASELKALSLGKTIGDALSEGFGKAGAALGKMLTVYESWSDKEKSIQKLRDIGLKNAEGNATQIAKVEKMAADASLTAQVEAYSGMIGAAKEFFNEHSKGYAVLEAVERGFRVFELLMAAKTFAEKMGFIATETAATVASEKTMQAEKGATALASALGAPFPMNFIAFAAVAAMLAGIGVALKGGGGDGPSISELTQKATGTGTILGDAGAKSESIAKSIKIVEKNSEINNRYSAGMLKSLQNIEASMTGLSKIIIRSGVTEVDTTAQKGGAEKLVDSLVGNFLGSVGLGVLSKGLGKLTNAIFGGKTTIEDFGIRVGYQEKKGTTLSQTLGEILTDGFRAFTYTVLNKEGGLLGSDKQSVTTGTLSDDIQQQFGLVVKNIRDGIVNAGSALGLTSDSIIDKLNSFVVDMGRISLKDLDSEGIQEQFSAAFSKLGDQLAEAIVPKEFLDRYQQIGEGAMETLLRVASNIATLNGLLAQMGINVDEAFGAVGLAAVDAKMQLIEFAGGIESFGEKINAYFDKFYTDQEKQALALQDISAKFSAMGLSLSLGSDVAANLASFRQLVELQDLSTEAGRRAYAALLEIAPNFYDLVDSLGTTASGILGLGATTGISDEAMKAANLWWEAYGGSPAASTAEMQLTALNTISDKVATDESIALLNENLSAQNVAMNEQNLQQAQTITMLQAMVEDNQAKYDQQMAVLVATNQALTTEVQVLQQLVAEGSNKTVTAINDTNNGSVIR